MDKTSFTPEQKALYDLFGNIHYTGCEGRKVPLLEDDAGSFITQAGDYVSVAALVEQYRNGREFFS